MFDCNIVYCVSYIFQSTKVKNHFYLKYRKLNFLTCIRTTTTLPLFQESSIHSFQFIVYEIFCSNSVSSKNVQFFMHYFLLWSFYSSWEKKKRENWKKKNWLVFLQFFVWLIWNTIVSPQWMNFELLHQNIHRFGSYGVWITDKSPILLPYPSWSSLSQKVNPTFLKGQCWLFYRKGLFTLDLQKPKC
jgi:hypothetical protein